MATCHPERKYHAKGLCKSCYSTAQARRNDYMYQKIWKAKHPLEHNAHRRAANRRYYQKNKGKIQRRQFLWEWARKGVSAP